MQQQALITCSCHTVFFLKTSRGLGQCQITEPSVMCQRNECLPVEQNTHRSDGQTGIKRGPKLYLLSGRCLLRNQNKTLYQHSLFCQPVGKRVDGDTKSQQCRSPEVAQKADGSTGCWGVVTHPVLQVTGSHRPPNPALPALRTCWCQREGVTGSELPAPAS